MTLHAQFLARLHVLGLVLTTTVAVDTSATDLVGDTTPAHCTSQLPSENKAPHIAGPLYDGADVVRIHNQVPGATLLVMSENDGIILGPVATKDGSSFAIPARAAGDALWVCQSTLNSICGPRVTVDALPPVLREPYAPHVVVQGAHAIQVARIEPGATAVIRDGSGAILGSRFAGPHTSVAVPVDPNLPAWTGLSVTQEIGAMVSSPAAGVILPSLGLITPFAPRILGPIEEGDLAVWVSGVTPGARVEIVEWASNDVIAVADVGEPIAKVPTCGLENTVVYARATRNGQSASGGLKTPFPWRAEEPIRTDEDWSLGSVVLQDGTQADVIVRAYYPDNASEDAPIAFILHGVPPVSLANVASDSHHGYAYIAEELASLGIYVVSVSLVGQTWPYPTLRVDGWDRAIALDYAIDWIAGAVWQITENSRAVLIGHSTGGEGVILSSERPQPLNVTGVVALSPTSTYMDEREPADGPDALFVKGSHDLFYNDGGSFLKSEHQYDNAWRDKTAVFIDGAGHWEFNSVWADAERDGEMSIDEQQAITRSLILPWVYGHAYNVYGSLRGYYEGTVRRRGLNRPSMTFQHASENVHTIVDTFGDAPAEHAFPNTNQDATVNAQGGLVFEINPASGVVEDDHDTFADRLSGYSAVHYGGHRVAKVKWRNVDYAYVTELPVSPNLEGNDVLSLRVMIHGEHRLNNPRFAQDFMLGIADGSKTAYVRVGSQGEVRRPFSDDANSGPLHVFQTVRVPIDAFLAVRPNLDIDAIERVEIMPWVRGTGVIFIDDLMFSD